jgi:hypothetical protein
LRRSPSPAQPFPPPPQPASHNVILVTADGLRWQDAFRGLDPLLAKEKSAHMPDKDPPYLRYWRTARPNAVRL